MKGRFVALLVMLALTVFGAVPALAAGGADLGEGELADVAYGATALEWRINVEHEAVTLTISTPCGIIQRAYEAGENPFFDLKELSPDDPNGLYTWQIRIAPVVDSKVQDMLNEARGTGNEQEVFRYLRRKGALPQGPFLQTGSFSVVEGGIVVPTAGEEKRASEPLQGGETGLRAVGAAAAAEEGLQSVLARQVISGDLTVYNSLCVGFDCPNNPSFGADTIRLQENNLRIHVDDTSTAASFPSTDWRLEFNSNVNGGGGWFRVIDVSANRNVMTIEAGAPSHALYVDNGGRVGTGTANPVLEFHAANGDTPGLRLEQTTASGFAAQTWDLAGNETSLFIRDASNGSTLPFRVFPGSPSNTLVVRNGNVGIGTTSPDEKLHIQSAGALRYRLENTAAATEWDVNNDGNGDFVVSLVGTGASELEIEQDGDIGNCGNPDHDFVISTGPGCTATPRSWIDAGDVSFSTSSSRTYKENLQPIAISDILQKIREVPVYQYDFIGGPSDRIGVLAEDFHQIFGRGLETELSGHDMQVAMWLAIQQLDQRDEKLARTADLLNEKDAQIQSLEQRLAALEELLAVSSDQ